MGYNKNKKAYTVKEVYKFNFLLMNKHHHVQGEPRSTRNSDVRQTPPRVAPRLKAVVKNKGIKEQKKEPKNK